MVDAEHTFRRHTVRLTELVTAESPAMIGWEFYDCILMGPAVLLIQGGINSELTDCSFNDAPAEAVLWEIPPTRRMVGGVIQVRDCVFRNCDFRAIGIAGSPDFIAALRASTWAT